MSHQAQCLVCRDPMGHTAVCCPICNTPSHPECLEYAGRCPVYGCSGAAPRRGEVSPVGPAALRLAASSSPPRRWGAAGLLTVLTSGCLLGSAAQAGAVMLSLVPISILIFLGWMAVSELLESFIRNEETVFDLPGRTIRWEASTLGAAQRDTLADWSEIREVTLVEARSQDVLPSFGMYRDREFEADLEWSLRLSRNGHRPPLILDLARELDTRRSGSAPRSRRVRAHDLAARIAGLLEVPLQVVRFPASKR